MDRYIGCEERTDPLNSFMEKSISCYQKMLDIYAGIQKAVAGGASAEVLQGWIEHLQTVEQKARSIDAEIWAKASEPKARLTDQPLFFEWQNLLTKVRQESLEMHRRLHSALAVLRDECSRINDRKQGIAGYHSGRRPAGRRINIPSA